MVVTWFETRLVLVIYIPDISLLHKLDNKDKHQLISSSIYELITNEELLA